MSSENTVKTASVVFGTAGTSTTIPAGSTGTSIPFPLPRQDFTVVVTVFGSMVTTTASTTASATSAAVCKYQGSNDNVGWFDLTSASATSTILTTATGVVLSLTTAVSTGVKLVSQRYAFGRAIVTPTGTGSAAASIAF